MRDARERQCASQKRGKSPRGGEEDLDQAKISVRDAAMSKYMLELRRILDKPANLFVIRQVELSTITKSPPEKGRKA